MIHDTLSLLAETPGRNDKIAILSDNACQPMLSEVINLALNPYTQFYIRKIPEYISVETGYISLQEGLAQLSKLSNREVTGNAAIEHLASILSSVTPDDAQVIEKIIKKDLRCGVQASTVNKVWHKLIPSYPCLLASAYSQKLVDQVVWPAYAQHKLDGMRVNITVKDGNVSLCGRSGKPIELLGQMDDQIKEYDFVRQLIVPMNGCVYDGELVVLEPDGTIMSRKKGNGIINKAIKGKISADEASRVRVVLWDMIPLDDFVKEKCLTPYEMRWGWLNFVDHSTDVMDPLRKDQKIIQLAETRVVSSEQEASDYFQEMLARGQEGIILKTYQAIWENKRSKGLIKYKAELDCELIVTEWIEGTGRNQFLLGALRCESSDGAVVVNVGTGYTDDDRVNLTPVNTVGKIVTVLYNERISSKDRQGVDSLFLPRIVEFREDKDEADHSNKIK